MVLVKPQGKQRTVSPCLASRYPYRGASCSDPEQSDGILQELQYLLYLLYLAGSVVTHFLAVGLVTHFTILQARPVDLNFRLNLCHNSSGNGKAPSPLCEGS